MKYAAITLVFLVTLAAAPAAFAIDECFQCVPVEIMQTVCFVYDLYNGTKVPYTCGNPPLYDPIWQGLSSTVLPKETGFKRQVITATYYPPTIMAGHSASFQAWWNERLNAPPGSGPSGPANSYSTDIYGSSTCNQTYVMSQEYDFQGMPYWLKTWYCAEAGQGCPKTVYVYGTDGE